MHKNADFNSEYTFRDPFLRVLRSSKYILFKNLKNIFLFTLLGCCIFLIISFIYPVSYKTQIKFFVEDSKSSGGGLMSVLAGQFGLDIGNVIGGASVLSGDNVLELSRSKILLQRALQARYPDSGLDSTYSLADKYTESLGWKRKWAKSRKVGYVVEFSTNKVFFNRTEDSLWQLIFKRLLEKEIVVKKPDRKLSFYTIDLETSDEKLTAILSKEILKTTSNFYIEGRTLRLKNNITRVQNRLDSIKRVLDFRTYDAAYANLENQIDINMALSKPIALAELKSKDKIYLNMVYAELLKNLELLKTSLVQETPSILLIDEYKIPKRVEFKWYWALLLGGFVGSLIGFFYNYFFIK